MNGLVYLSGENIPLALGELKGAMAALGAGEPEGRSEGPVYVLDREPPKGLAARMGFCHFDGTIAGSCPDDPGSILSLAREVLRESEAPTLGFTVKTGGIPPPKEIFDPLESMARSMGHRIAHRGCAMRLFVASAGGTAYVGWVGSISDRSALLGRRGSLMPFSRPVVMDPRLSRAMVNLTGLPPGSRVLDPFLGPAGLAIEASHLGLTCAGIEIDPGVISGARRNVDSLAVPGSVESIEGDSRYLGTLLKGNVFDGILTDPPFGRSASLRGSSHSDLIEKVMVQAGDLVGTGAPLVMDTPLENDITLEGFRFVSRFSHRVHRSMTRHILVFRKV